MLFERMEDRLFADMAKQISYVRVTPATQAEGLTAKVYEQLRSEFQILPPLTLHSPAPRLLAGAWAIARESQIASGLVRRDLKEAVAGSVSALNACPYCVDAHTAMLHASSEHEAAVAIRSGGVDRLHDQTMRQTIQWATATRDPQSEVLAKPPFSVAEGPEIIGTALSYHYINRMVHVFLVDTPLPIAKPGRAQDFARRVFGATFARRMVRRSPAPSDSRSLFGTIEVDLPPDLAWAEPNPSVAAAFAGFAAVTEEAGARIVSPEAQNVVLGQIDAWSGGDKGLSRAWVNEAVAGLSEADRVTARLCLLTALASFQVDESTVAAFRRFHGNDAALIEATAWASFAAVRRIGSWLTPQAISFLDN